MRVTARAIGIDPGYLSRLELGQRAPRMAVAVRWVRVVGLDGDLADELLDAAVERRWPDG